MGPLLALLTLVITHYAWRIALVFALPYLPGGLPWLP